jgi:hypothetical protein
MSAGSHLLLSDQYDFTNPGSSPVTITEAWLGSWPDGMAENVDAGRTEIAPPGSSTHVFGTTSYNDSSLIADQRRRLCGVGQLSAADLQLQRMTQR